MIRVRAALSDSDFVRKLRGKIPKEAFHIPDEILVPSHYPTMLLNYLPPDNKYSYLGLITEKMLKCPDVNSDSLLECTKTVASVTLPVKVLMAKTTTRFINSVKVTAEKLNEIIGPSSVTYETPISIEGCQIEGHPDILTADKVLEVKTSGQIKQNWSQFLLQTFSYAALYPQARTIYIVLPLQEFVWSYDVNSWPKRKLFVDVLRSYQGNTNVDSMFQPLMISTFPIGYHITKQKSVRATMQGIRAYNRPYQIFFTNKAASFHISDAEIAEAAEFISASDARLYVHTPYLLNLCMEPGTTDEPNYVVESLRKHLTTSAAMGLRGVVVHVGKAVKLDMATAKANMTVNLKQVLEAATSDCPLLLETPAGQGTETLTELTEFMEFATSFQHPAFGVCIDTCHVFATGYLPLEYLENVVENEAWCKLVKLIHFNDSKTEKGSRVDRHAQLGTGCIPKQQFYECAQLATRNGIPMIIE